MIVVIIIIEKATGLADVIKKCYINLCVTKNGVKYPNN